VICKSKAETFQDNLIKGTTFKTMFTTWCPPIIKRYITLNDELDGYGNVMALE